ncbi:probable LINE-1 retrotransposable element ORF2 protein at N-terminal half [Coccomyxa sp. Obi]|nr:probable LINE-1 retrotransposable element ORF2 protein at N-terminal half [Coccomyxa sp. Obi]
MKLISDPGAPELVLLTRALTPAAAGEREFTPHSRKLDLNPISASGSSPHTSAHPLGPELSRGRRWEDLKRHVKDIALQRSWALAAQRRASQTALESDSRAALTQYTSSPTAHTLLAWLEAHHLLQALNAEAAKGAALQAGIVWQYYGEQSTFWFHHLAKERQSRTEIKALRPGGAPDSPPVLLDTPAGRNKGSQLLRDFYSGDSAAGLFAARPVLQPAQAELLAALDKSLTPEEAAAADGASGDGSIPVTELEAALRSMPRGKAPGLDGIPYEFYQRFWPLVGEELTAVLQEAFTSPASPALPPSMLQGRIILLYKGKGADRASPASYRPITLLNTDYKLAARTVASRLGPVLNQVVDPTQTGFLPKRWVGDNVLAHLEEISYLEDTQQPGVIVFLDFEKAFDRLDRAWIEQCISAVGFGAGAQRWVHILHTGTTARVAFNGWHTDAFPVSSGVFQGSPLSPLLFVLATQPMAAHARRCAHQRAFQPIRLPSGDPAPVMHQHADDTSIHAQSPRDAQVILDTTVDLHCAATGSKLQRSKSQGLGLGSFSHLEGPDAATGVTFAAQDASVKHLGVPLSRQPEIAATALYTAILKKVESKIARWSGFRLSLLGRAYVAKQLLASMVTYHATFIPVPSQLEKRLCKALHTFVAANRPVLSGTSARLYPGKDTCFHAVKDGGIALVDLRAQILALQAKVVSRLLEPEQLAWKAFFDFWLYRSTAWQAAQASARLAAHHQHIWQLGRFLPFSAYDAQKMQAPLRVHQYVYAYQKLQPHRLSQPDSLGYHEVMSEPLFFNRQVRDPAGQPIALEAWARQGLVRVRDLRTLVHSPPPDDTGLQPGIQLLLAALPAQWRSFVQGPPPAAPWLASPGQGACQVWSQSDDGSYAFTHTASSSGALVPVPAGLGPQPPLPATAQPVLVQGWDITRPWHPRNSKPQTQDGQQQQDDLPAQAQEDQQDQDDQPLQRPPSPLYIFGFWGTHMVNPTSWGLGKRPAHQYVVKEATLRRQVLHRLKHGHPQSPMRPAIWADSTDDQRSGLRAIEAHWAATAAGAGSSQRSLGKRRPGEPDPSSHAAWMSPPPKRPPPWRDRPHPQASAPAPRTPRQQCPPDTVDAAATARGPQPPWAHVWRVIDTSHLDRGQRMTVWRLLHGKLFVGAFARHIHRPEAAGYSCPHPLCTEQDATLTHVFITCPLAATVWGWKAILCDWRLATVNVRTASGVLSDWLRGRDPQLTREEFAARWCHRNVLCAVGEEPDAQLLIPWSAQHPVPLPA